MSAIFPYKTEDFDYQLPSELIAQTPVEPRDHSRLMVLDRRKGNISHRYFYEIADFLLPGDVLVFNESRVIPARLLGKKIPTGGKVEILLLQRKEAGIWEAMVKPGRRLPVGAEISIDTGNNGALTATIVGRNANGTRNVSFSDESLLKKAGRIALPPYIHAPVENLERYQTVYAKNEGSVAAPTAGLHFTPELLERLKQKGIISGMVTLHVGLDTFQPVREEDPTHHIIHREWGFMDDKTVDIINCAIKENRRIICVGTTSVRIIEHAASQGLPLKPFNGWIDLFILPGYEFKVTSAMITNFHLPRTTLIMLVSAFAGKEFIDKAYAEAIRERYRFYSFGDAMLII